MKKVYVALLNMGEVVTGLESSLYKWMQSKKGYQFFFQPRKEIPTDSNRNHIVADFLKTDMDYLAMFDCDTYPLLNPFNMLDSNKDVIGGAYFGWGKNGLRFHVYQKNKEKSLAKIQYLQYPPAKRGGLQKVDAVGAGCMLIKRRVLEKIKKPFAYIYEPHIGRLKMSDDIAFCYRCQKAGFEVWVNWDHIASHFKTVDLLAVARLVMEATKTGVPKLAINDVVEYKHESKSKKNHSGNEENGGNRKD